MDKIKLIFERHLITIMLIILLFALAIYVSVQILWPKVNQIKNIISEISSNEVKYEELLKKKEEKDNAEKQENRKIKEVPVKIFKSQNKNLPIDASYIDFVSALLSLLEQTNNTIIDISYSIDTLSAEEKTQVPENVSVVQLTLTLNSTYAAFQDFVTALYNSEDLATIKQIKAIPLKENKNYLEIETVIWLYVAK